MNKLRVNNIFSVLCHPLLSMPFVHIFVIKMFHVCKIGAGL